MVDASVALKWAFDDEEYVREAVALRDDWLRGGNPVPVAPSLFFYEVINGVVVACRRRRLTEEIGLNLVARFSDLGVRYVDPDGGEVYKLASRFAISGYDAAYVALGEALGCTVWTGDRALHRAVSQRVPRLRWIAEYGASG